MYNIQQQKASSNWLESKIKKSVMEQQVSSLQPVNSWLLPNLSWKWTSIQLLSSQLIIKPLTSPKKSLKIVQNQLIPATIKKFFLLYKTVSELSLPADGENLFQTLPLKQPKSLWEKEPKRNLTLKSKDTLKLKKFQEELLNNPKFLTELWLIRISPIQKWEEQLKTQESFYLTVHWNIKKVKVKPICNLKLKTPCVKLSNNKLKKSPWCAMIFLSGNQISSLLKKVFQIWLNTFYWKETFHVSEE